MLDLAFSNEKTTVSLLIRQFQKALMTQSSKI